MIERSRSIRRFAAELAFRTEAQTGESPFWSDREKALYWIDVDAPALHRLVAGAGDAQRWPLPAQVGAFTLCRSGRILAAIRTGLLMLDQEAGTAHIVAEPPYDPRYFRFNDGKCDKRGRFWIGSMYDPADPESSGDEASRGDLRQPLRCFEGGRSFIEVDAAAKISNGLAWSPDGKTLYFSDTAAHIIRTYSFDLSGAKVTNEKIFASCDSKQWKPDGAAVDQEGCYWVAAYGAGKIMRFTPGGNLEVIVDLPVSQPTMCAFGGASLDTLFITTARAGLDEAALQKEPLAGSLFCCRPGVRGLPAQLFDDGELRP